MTARPATSRLWRRALAIAALALPMLATASPARAGILANTDAKGSVGDLVYFVGTFNGHTEGMLAGTLTTRIGNGPAFDAYCIDLYHYFYVGGGGSNWEVDPDSIAHFAPQPSGGNGLGVGYLYDTFAATVSTDIDRAALQVALWKVVYDNGGSLTTGQFTVADSADLNSAQHQIFASASSILSHYNGTQTGSAILLKAHHIGDLYQDLVAPNSIRFDLGGQQAVPEPSTVALLGSGLVAMGGVWLRRKKKA